MVVFLRLLYLVMSRALVVCLNCCVAALLAKLLPPVILVSLVMIVMAVNMLTCGCVEILYYYLVVVVQPIPFSLDFSRIVSN